MMRNAARMAVLRARSDCADECEWESGFGSFVPPPVGVEEESTAEVDVAKVPVPVKTGEEVNPEILDDCANAAAGVVACRDNCVLTREAMTEWSLFRGPPRACRFIGGDSLEFDGLVVPGGAVGTKGAAETVAATIGAGT